MKRLNVLLLSLMASVGIAHAASGKNDTDKKAQAYAAAAALRPTASLRAASDGAIAPFAVSAPQGTPCGAGASDIIIHDDGEVENGYGFNADNVTEGRLVDRFTPLSYPATVSTVCFAFLTTTDVSAFDFDVVVYDDSGVGGGPGVLLGSEAMVGHPVSVDLPQTATFESFDISDLDLDIAGGTIYIGARWAPSAANDGVFIASDESTTTPLAGGYFWANEDPWIPTGDPTLYPDYRSLMVRAAVPPAGPGAPSVAKAFAPGQILANETSTLTITLRNTSQPTSAATLSSDLTDTLPTGVVVAPTPNASTTCTGTLTATAGSGSVTLGSGGQIPAASSCTISVDVTSAADATYVNTIAAGALATDLGSNVNPATATLVVGYIFPEPYCNISFPSSVEPITHVLFDGIDNVTDPTVDGSPELENYTGIIGNVAPGQTLSMAVEGNTNGSFTTVITAYIDWNQNGVFTDAGETYAIGNIVNSDGTDGIQAVADIEVPVDALPGNTRMRVTKKYNSAALSCNSSGYGQAEDYTLTVAPASPAPTVVKSFAPAQVMAGDPSTLTITLSNTQNAIDATLDADLVDTFPSGLVIADTPNTSTTCTGTVTAVAGSGSVTLPSGSSIPASGTCTISVDVESATDGTYANTIPAGALSTDQGDSPFAANATLKVGYTFPEPYCAINFPSAVEPISHVAFDGIDNPSDPTVDASPALEDFTSIIGAIAAADTVPMAVQGNTNGSFTTVITTYIDWNQNGVFTDPGETYAIGTITDSDGTDGIQAVADITAPANALPGPTRMRVTKKFNTAADSCNTTGYGQAEDYTVVVGPAVPKVAKSFTPASVGIGADSTATITLSNPTGSDATLTAPFTDNLPAGLVMTGASTSCGLIVGQPLAPTGTGGASITLPAGLVLPAGSTCQINATVHADAVGDYTNLIPAGALQTDQGNSATAASATLTVLPPPLAEVTPVPVVLTVQADATASTPLTIANNGGEDLTYALTETSGTAQSAPRSYLTSRMAKLRAASPLMSMPMRNARAGGHRLGLSFPLADTMISQMEDNSPGDQGVSCNDGSATVDNSWWRRFYFSEYPGVGGQAAITAVTISSGSDDVSGHVAGLPITINLYTIDHAVAVDTIPTASLTLIGTGSGTIDSGLISVTIPVTGLVDDTAGKDLVVEYHTDGIDPGVFYPGANDTTETHPTFMSSTACSLDEPTPAAEVGDGFPDFHLTMVVTLGDAAPVGCQNPVDVPWLSETPTSGTVAGGASATVTVKANATGLAAGDYSANICVATNDPTQRFIPVPVNLTVTPGPITDRIFCDGFDGTPCTGGGGGSGDVITGTINQPVVMDGDGSTLDFVTGLYAGYDAGRIDDINLYYLPSSQDGTGPGLYVYWYGDAVPLPVQDLIGGVVATPGSNDFAVLQSGDTVGPASPVSAASVIMANWLPTQDGYLGVVFYNEDTEAINYGYIHMTTTGPTSFPVQALDYGYDPTGAAVTIP